MTCHAHKKHTPISLISLLLIGIPPFLFSFSLVGMFLNRRNRRKKKKKGK